MAYGDICRMFLGPSMPKLAVDLGCLLCPGAIMRDVPIRSGLMLRVSEPLLNNLNRNAGLIKHARAPDGGTDAT